MPHFAKNVEQNMEQVPAALTREENHSMMKTDTTGRPARSCKAEKRPARWSLTRSAVVIHKKGKQK